MTFVVRMWRDGDVPAHWRGSVDDVGNGKRFYFTNVGAMCEFMLEERERGSA